MENLHSIFIAEAKDLIVELERALLELERNQENKECISSVFRAMHTLKGSAGMFGFESISSLTHHLENIYAEIRDGRRRLEQDILSTTLKSIDHLKKLLNDATLSDGSVRQAHQDLMKQIEVLSESKEEAILVEKEDPVKAGLEDQFYTYYVIFNPKSDILKNGTNPLYLADDLLTLGKGISMPFFENIPPLGDLVPDLSYTGFEVILCTSKMESEIKEVFMFVESEARLLIKNISKGNLLSDENIVQEILNELKITSPIGLEVIESILVQDTMLDVVATESNKNRPVSSVRVSSERLDEFMNLVSELVTTQASLSLYGARTESAELMAIAENVEKITRRLRDNAFSMSLVPIESLVVRFQRLIRDLSKDLNKDILFKAEGTETEIDKAIVEKLSDPILHIMRNAVDHGIEMPQERLKKGKPAQGVVHLKSFYSGANVLIEISDDGAGINLDKVRKSAIKKGIINPETQISEQEIINLIFMPGFSTAEAVTDVSGRGVGMDVLRKNIADIQGEVSVRTKEGQGSTFTIKLPLTLSIIDGLLVKVGETDFIIPLASVGKCYEVETKKLEKLFNQRISLDGELTPFLFLRSEFEEKSDYPALSQVIKITYENVQIGLVVDRILGECQAVLKPLGYMYRQQDEFSGATILGDGSVALVIDPYKLSRKLITSQTKIKMEYEQAN